MMPILNSIKNNTEVAKYPLIFSLGKKRKKDKKIINIKIDPWQFHPKQQEEVRMMQQRFSRLY
ncbi:MAG: hypothetical protein KKB19_07960, partial [Bacteroidetes bacterium]|nr:hypothetical protein [Bacteroidota bacterium]